MAMKPWRDFRGGGVNRKKGQAEDHLCYVSRMCVFACSVRRAPYTSLKLTSREHTTRVRLSGGPHSPVPGSERVCACVVR